MTNLVFFKNQIKEEHKMRCIIIFSFIFLLSFTNLFAQKITISADDIILLKKEGFSDSTLNIIVVSDELGISIDELINLKKAGINENTIIKLAISEEPIKNDKEKEASKHTVEEWLKKASDVWNKEKDIKRSIELTKNAYTLNPNRLDTNFNLAILFTYKLDVKNAIYHYEKVYNIQPEKEGNFYLGILYLLDGQKDKGKNQIKNVKKKSKFENGILKALKKYTIENISDTEICFKDKNSQIQNYYSFIPKGKLHLKIKTGNHYRKSLNLDTDIS